MLRPWRMVPASEIDQIVFEALVPANHYLRRVKAVLDFQKLRPLLAASYPATTGRPAVEPILLLKLEFLEYQYNLSDREVINQAQVNVAFRFFLDLSLHSELPHHTLFTYFRDRLGVDQHQKVFEAVVAQARQHGLVKDRLRLKDATHVIANIAIPSTLQLVAQTRDKVLAAAEALAPDWVAEQRQQADNLRVMTESLADAERLGQRVHHLRQMVMALQQRWEQAAASAISPARYQPLRDMLDLAQHVLADRQEPSEGHKTDHVVSVHDPEARCGKHGDWYKGYLLDIAMDADSDLITAVNVLPANGDEGGDAVTLITQEEEAHGNEVEQLSLDGAGFRGSLLRELTDPEGLDLEVFTPPTAPAQTNQFPPEAFTLDESGEELTCPQGQKTRRRKYSPADHGWRFRFTLQQCGNCPLRAQCFQKPENRNARVVIKNDYEAEYRAARAKAKTSEFAAVRKVHRKIERKLGELVRWHRGRRARYWGTAKTLVQALLTSIVVNTKRMVHMLAAPSALSQGTVRAELAPTG